jgi:hypothetical protein
MRAGESKPEKDKGGNRSIAPVFVLGSPRSGTTLLYDMLLSAGGFAVYLAESNVFNLLAIRFGDLGSRTNRGKLWRVWAGSKLFRATGLNSSSIRKKILEECRDSGDFLRIVMDAIASEQGAQRWAENSPEAILHLPLIKKLIPDALVIHIIRDGRDVALSLSRVRYLRPFPGQKRPSVLAAGVYWDWIVQRGREYGKALGADYLEIHFEDLVASPQQTLDQVGAFVEQALDYQKIRRIGYGSVNRPNTSFSTEHASGSFNPVGRWKAGLPPEQLARLEGIIGKSLQELGYAPAFGSGAPAMTAEMRSTRLLYRSYFQSKLWLKLNPLIRLLRPELTAEEIDATVLAEDHAPDVRTLLSQTTQ